MFASLGSRRMMGGGFAAILSTLALQKRAVGVSIPAEPLKLYQYEVCPFCNKVQTFLEYHGIPYSKMEVNPLTKAEIKFQDYRMVPFAIIDGSQVNGSGTIIKSLLNEEKLSEDEDKWFSWVDDHLVHVLPVNIYRTPKEALQSFEYITNQSNFTSWQKFSIQYGGALAMFFIAKRSKKKYNLGDDPREELVNAVEIWTNEGLAGKEFHSGKEEPDTADLAVFGVLRSIDGHYQTWHDLKKADFSNNDQFWHWFGKMKTKVESNKTIIEGTGQKHTGKDP